VIVLIFVIKLVKLCLLYFFIFKKIFYPLLVNADVDEHRTAVTDTQTYIRLLSFAVKSNWIYKHDTK